MSALALCLIQAAAALPTTTTHTAPSKGLSAQLKVGFPWLGVAVNQPLYRRLSLGLESETSLAKRWESRAGLHRQWRVGSSWLLALGAGAGWVIQKPTVPRQGVQGFGRFRMAYQGRLSPWLTVDYRYLAALRQRSIQSSQGTRSAWRMTPYASLVTHLGLRASLGAAWSVDAHVVLGTIDGVFAIPGASLGLRWAAP